MKISRRDTIKMTGMAAAAALVGEAVQDAPKLPHLVELLALEQKLLVIGDVVATVCRVVRELYQDYQQGRVTNPFTLRQLGG